MNLLKARLSETAITRAMQIACLGVAVLVGVVHLATFPLKLNVELAAAAQSAGPLAHLGMSQTEHAIIGLLPHTLAVLIMYVCGPILMRASPNDRMALLTAAAMMGFSELLSDNQDLLRKAYPTLATWPSDFSKSIGYICTLSMAYRLPNGRAVPKWMRVPFTLFALWYFIGPFLGYSSFNPHRDDIWNYLNQHDGDRSYQWFLLSWYVAAILAQMYRYFFVSSVVERLQMRRVLLGFLIALPCFVLTEWQLLNMPGEPDWASGMFTAWLRDFVRAIGFAAVPITITFAVLRNRLFDARPVISRALEYTALTASVIAVYALIVGVLGTVLNARGSFFFSLLAAGIIAVLFQPVRERLQRAIGRALYGNRDDPRGVLAKLSQRMSATMQPEAVLPTIVEVVAQSLKLPYVAVTLKQGQGDDYSLAAESSRERDLACEMLPLVYQSETVGKLVVSPRAAGEAFNSADRRLLGGIADQIGVAAYAVRVSSDLQRSREQLVLAREEERRRIRNDLHDGLGPMLANLRVRVDAARRFLVQDQDKTDQILTDLRGQLQDTVADVRRMVYDLRPPALDQFGLLGALDQFAKARELDGLHIQIEAPASLPALPAAIEVAAYRIAIEAINNVTRHAHAHTCEVRVFAQDRLHLEICDDGTGISSDAQPGIGLTSMRARAEELGGTFDVASAAEHGTRILVTLPFDHHG